MRRTLFLLGLVGVLSLASGQGRMAGFDFAAHEAVMDSLSQMHPRLRGRWLNERGLEMPGINAPLPGTSLLDSGGLRMVGKWGRGPSVAVTGRDSLVFLSLGSQVAIINFADPDNPEVLSEPQAMGLVTQAAVRDSFLYIGARTGQAGIEVWNIADPRNPVFRSRTPTLLSDFCIRDTFLYLTQSLSGPNDTFKIYSIANPENLRLLGACRDSGDAVTVTNNTAFLADRWGLYALDVSDPANPRRVGGFGVEPISVQAHGNICYASVAYTGQPGRLDFHVLDVTDPADIRSLGRLSDAGGYDIHIADTLAFLSGYYTGGHVFRIIDISDAARPRHIGSSTTPGGHLGVWADLANSRAYVADRFSGLTLVDIRNLAVPYVDTSFLGGGAAKDVCLDGGLAYVASDAYGMTIIDITDPAVPTQLGAVHGRGMVCRSTAARDSFAYMGYAPGPLQLRSIDVSDPTRPDTVGGLALQGWAEAMALRGSILYIAEAGRFEIVNVARPREPVLVGSCGLPGTPLKLTLGDSVAYAATFGVQCINVVNPDNPYVAGVYSTRVSGMDIADTVLYGAGPYTGIIALSIANPVAPRLLDSLHLTDTLWWNDVAVVDSLAYVAGERIWAVDVSDPRDLRLVPGVSWTPPYLVRRLVYAAPYLYVACYDAGIAVLEIVPTGMAEKGGEPKTVEAFQMLPSPVRGRSAVRLGREVRSWAVRDVTGRLVSSGAVRPEQQTLELDLTDRPAGVYVLELTTPAGKVRGKFVKQ